MINDLIFKVNNGLITNLNNMLILSVELGTEVYFLEFLDKKGADFNVLDAEGNSLLFLCHHPKVMEFLLTKNINIHHRNFNNDTAFLQLIQDEPQINNIDTLLTLLSLLLDNGANINDTNGTKNALMYLIDINILKFLVNKGIDINLQNPTLTTILMKVCSVLSVPKLSYLLTIPSLNVNLQDQNQKTALHHLVREGLVNYKNLFLKCISLLLLNTDINVNLRDNNGFTAFALFCNGFNHPEYFNHICSLFLNKRLNINDTMEFLGESNYLDFCITNPRLNSDNIEFLLQNGANIRFRAISQSIMRNNTQNLGLLFKYGANPNLTDGLGRSLLFYVNEVDTFIILMDNNADINYVNTRSSNEIKTALDQYADINNINLVLYAISAGAKITNFVSQKIRHEYINIILHLEEKSDDELKELFLQDHCFWIRTSYHHNKKVYYKLIKIYQNYLYLPEDTIYNIAKYECL